MIKINNTSVTIAFCLLFIFFSCDETKPAFTPFFTISEETTHKIPDGQNYTFGYLEVLENRNNPQGNTIQLPVYIFTKSQSKKRSNHLYGWRSRIFHHAFCAIHELLSIFR